MNEKGKFNTLARKHERKLGKAKRRKAYSMLIIKQIAMDKIQATTECRWNA